MIIEILPSAAGPGGWRMETLIWAADGGLKIFLG
jgi:hypothetical protein